MVKANDAFRNIHEASEELDVPQHVLRFWETKFPEIQPLKRGGPKHILSATSAQLSDIFILCLHWVSVVRG